MLRPFVEAILETLSVHQNRRMKGFSSVTSKGHQYRNDPLNLALFECSRVLCELCLRDLRADEAGAKAAVASLLVFVNRFRNEADPAIVPVELKVIFTEIDLKLTQTISPRIDEYCADTTLHTRMETLFFKFRDVSKQTMAFLYYVLQQPTGGNESSAFMIDDYRRPIADIVTKATSTRSAKPMSLMELFLHTIITSPPFNHVFPPPEGALEIDSDQRCYAVRSTENPFCLPPSPSATGLLENSGIFPPKSVPGGPPTVAPHIHAFGIPYTIREMTTLKGGSDDEKKRAIIATAAQLFELSKEPGLLPHLEKLVEKY